MANKMAVIAVTAIAGKMILSCTKNLYNGCDILERDVIFNQSPYNSIEHP